LNRRGHPYKIQPFPQFVPLSLAKNDRYVIHYVNRTISLM
jgi:hypothetical protein